MVARRAAALVLAAALATGLAACGGGDDEDSSSDDVELEDVESDASASDADDEEAASDDEEADDSSDDSGDDASDSDDVIEGAFSEGCGEFSSVFGALGAASAGAFDPEAADDFEGFIDDAPEEIQDDLETLSTFYEEVAAAFESAGIDPEDPSSIDPSNPEVLEILTELSETLAAPEFLEANQAISDFIASGCET